LEHEIKTLTQHLESTVEELEMSNQDLISSNEELLSVNEELQSTNEELQTSTEELQSVNEELGTVNAQLETKVEELDRSNADVENLFRSTDIATLFLDKNFRIKKFTPAAQTLFRFLEIDVGRPISDLASFFQDSTLRADIEEVLRTSHPKEKERLFPHGSLTYLSRIIPYRTPENQVEGVVLTFIDITRLRQVENQVLQFSRQQAVIGAFGQFSLQEYDLQKVMDVCVRQNGSALPVEYIKVLELRPDGQSFLFRAGVGWKEGLVGHAVVGGERNSQAGYTLSVNDPVIVTDLSQETRFSGPSLLIDHQVVSGMSCIIRDHEGNPHGVLGVHSSSKREFSGDGVQFLQTMANILASAIHRKGVENQLQSMKDSLEDRVKDGTTALVQHQQRVRHLSSQLMLTEQRERRRIAKELHDYLGQLLVVGKIQLSQLGHAGLSESNSRIVRELDESLDSALTYTRDLISQISPPVLYEFELMRAIPWLAEKMSRYNLHVTVTSHLDDQSFLLLEPVSVIVYQILRELLFNVVKHGQTHEACIEITRLSTELIGFEVTDRGCGFDLQPLLETIAHSQKFGLLNVQERIETIGGQVKIHSKKGEGTRVHITVPFSPEEAAIETSPFPAPVVLSPLVQKEKGVTRVLIADDHAMFREGMRTLLESCPDIHVVGEAENGEQAISLAQSLQPDVVVMDINMPVMNGIEATRRIKLGLPRVHVIGLSMHSDEVVKNAFAEAGGDQYVTKGDSFNSFTDIIRSSQKDSGLTE
jgi:two-component system CheB/CheR fusion protein